jgi:hypothetical protein
LASTSASWALYTVSPSPSPVLLAPLPVTTRDTRQCSRTSGVGRSVQGWRGASRRALLCVTSATKQQLVAEGPVHTWSAWVSYSLLAAHVLSR